MKSPSVSSIAQLHRLFTVSAGMVALFLAPGALTSVQAQVLTYDYMTNLALNSGVDTAGLNGATVDVRVDVSPSAVYTTRFGLPAVVMNNDATYTISGSSIAANNGTFALGQLAFYPTFAGLFLDPAGIHPIVALPVGGTLDLHLNTFQTAHGSMVHVGDTVNVLDFAPATSQGAVWEGSSTTTYRQINPTVSAALTSPSAVPEPGVTATLAGIGVTGGLFAFRRLRRKR